MARRTTIFDALRTGEPARVKRKLAREPESISSRNEVGQTPLMVALYHARQDLVELLLEREPELDVFEAAALGRVDDLKRAIGRSKRRVDGLSSDGFAPLHLAAYFGRTDAVTFLLDRGADIEVRSTNTLLPGVTPLHSAAAGGRTEVALLLLDRGANPNAAQPGGWTPLHQAAATGDIVLCKRLLKAGAKRTVMADDRSRPIDFAIEKRHRDVVSLLQRGR